MAIKIMAIITDDAPIAPFSEPVEAYTVLDSPSMVEIVVTGVVDRPALQSYLMLMTAPLADAYELIITHPAVLQAPAGTADEIPSDVIPPEPPRLTTTAAPWNYSKPDGGLPIDGQIIQGNLTLKTLSVAAIDGAALDQTSMLELVKPGDFIAIDAVTWTVDAVAYHSTPEARWFDFLISPSDQAAVAGLVVVTFTPAAEVLPEPPTPPTPLPTTTAEWIYAKPASEPPWEPANGMLLHPNLSVDTLRISRIDFAAVDQSPMLDLVIQGDNIALGTSSWTVQIVSPTIGWIDFIVYPTVQDDTLDNTVVPVTFSRPAPVRRA